MFDTGTEPNRKESSRMPATLTAQSLPRESLEEPHMEAVIVATARTPIGRAGKGSLIDCRPDDLSATIVGALLAKVPNLDPGEVEDVIWGTASPAGESGYNMARVVA